MYRVLKILHCRISPNHINWRRRQISILYIRFSAFFHWKAIYKNVCKGLHKRTVNHWNSRSSLLEVFCKKLFLDISQNSLENTCASVSCSIKFIILTLWKMRLWHRYFPVNFGKVLRTPFLIEDLMRLLLELFLERQSIWHFKRNTIFSRINIIFFSDTKNVTFKCIFPGRVFFTRRAISYLQHLWYIQKISYFHVFFDKDNLLSFYV